MADFTREDSPRVWIRSFVGSMKRAGLTKEQIGWLVNSPNFNKWFYEEIESAYGREETNEQDTNH